MSLRVLLVEDDRELRTTLRVALGVEGYEVFAAASLADARAQMAHQEQHGGIDLLILDLGLPDGEGSLLLMELRKRSRVPVIIISARHDERPKIGLLDAGADDYLVKPFGIGELLARMRVTLRHRGTTLLAATTHYRHGRVSVDIETRQVLAGGAEVRLTPTEFSLLARLVRSAGRVVTHRQLLADVWGAEHVDNTQYLRLYMSQLRAKLELTPADPQFLLTEPGVGYRLSDPEDD
jgi:two-component system KDP operon response regulator KdpE